MLTDTTFWFGVVAGALLLYGWQHYQRRHASS